MKSAREQFVVDDKGRKTAIILSFEKYEQLLEDLHDLAVIAERRKEQPMDLEVMKQRLKENGDEKT
ncbi:MAG: type II toxin-antitoxin system Phd/YefM family antitoxin [Candidatus Hodarchaeota archaeon]